MEGKSKKGGETEWWCDTSPDLPYWRIPPKTVAYRGQTVPFFPQRVIKCDRCKRQNTSVFYASGALVAPYSVSIFSSVSRSLRSLESQSKLGFGKSHHNRIRRVWPEYEPVIHGKLESLGHCEERLSPCWPHSRL